MDLMKAAVFRGTGIVQIEERKKPVPRAGQAVIRITTTTICGTDVHIVKGEYPVKPGLILGHEPVGIIDSLGEGLEDEYFIGQRVIAGAITPCGQCFYCLNSAHSQCHGALGGWRFGNTIDGAWAEYLLVPDARANLAPIPDGVSDEQVVLVPDIFSTGLSGAESGNVRVGDSVAVFAQGPIGLCATLGAKLRGAALIIGVDAVPARLEMAKRFGANVVINYREQDPVAEIKKLTGGRGADVTIEALGQQTTFENALRATRPGGTLSSLGYIPEAGRPVRCILRRPRRPEDRHDALSGWERADAAADVDGGHWPSRSHPACHAPFRARRHRVGPRSLLLAARWGDEDRPETRTGG